jgi:midasin
MPPIRRQRIFFLDLGLTLASAQKWGAQERRLLLDVAAKWLLHPNVTVDAAVAFRPVIGELLHRLFSQPSRPTMTANPFPRIVCALSRILPITPQVQEEALTYLRGSLSVFEAVQHEFKLVGASHSDADSSMVSLCLEVVQAAYRFLRFSVASFRELWDWSPLFHLVSFSHQPDIASFAAQSLVLLLGMSDAETQGSLLFQHLLTNSSCIAVFDDREARNKSLRFATATPDQQFEGAFVTAADLSSAVVDVCGFLLPVKSSVSKAASALHYTSTTRANMQSLALAVCRGNPILLAGPTGAGKTYLIQQLANQTNNRGMYILPLI